jgi:predicted HTH domain antitoxin
MALVVSDKALQAAGLTEREALIEFACRLFDAGKLTLCLACELVELSRVEFERELVARKIPVYRPTVDDLQQDLATLDRLGA